MFLIILPLNIRVSAIILSVNIKTVKKVQAVTVCVYNNFVTSFTSYACINKEVTLLQLQSAKNPSANKGNIMPPENPYKCGSLMEIKSLNQTGIST